MNYLFHTVPKNLKGDILYPLNVLKNSDTDLYKEKVKKYLGREKILERKIPTLNCLWNDVLHLTAVHPETLVLELTKAGRPHQPMSFYQINPAKLNPQNLTIYLYKSSEKRIQLPDEEFVDFNLEELPYYSQIPDFTKNYYRERYESGDRPLLYHGVPHVLYKGEINTANLEIITV